MFRYLAFFAAAFYLVLLIGGEDHGQKRMGLTGAYAANVQTPAAPLPDPTVTEQAVTERTAVMAPADTLRILPAPSLSVAPADAQPAAVVSKASLDAQAAPDPFNNPTVTLRTITAEAANVRDAASRNGAVISRLERGEIVQMVEQVGDWVHIRLEGDGVDGYVHRRLISTEPPALTATTLFSVVD